MPAGLSFSPLNSDQPTQAKSAGSPLQEAIKILSFRMPTVVGASGVSPLANGDMGGGQVDQWLLNLFKGLLPADTGGVQTSGPFGPQGPLGAPTVTGGLPPAGPTGGSPPPPNVVTTPPDVPKVGPPDIGKGPINYPGGSPTDLPNAGPPDWRDWLGGGARFGG